MAEHEERSEDASQIARRECLRQARRVSGPWTAVDPDGGTVVLTGERWQHIKEGILS